VELMRNIRHPNIVGLHEVFETDRHLCLVIELVRGGDLLEHLNGQGPLSEAAARSLMTQLLLALQYLHEQGIIHRDLKPDNVLLAPSSPHPQVKISDFGLAKRLRGEYGLASTFCGTREYVAPEVLSCDGGGYSAAVDLWSAGVILYMLLSGAPPSAISSRSCAVRMQAPTAEEVAKAAWLAKTAKPAGPLAAPQGSVVSTAGYHSPSAAVPPTAASPVEMTCGWATDNFSAGTKKAHQDNKYAYPGSDHAFNRWSGAPAPVEHFHRATSLTPPTYPPLPTYPVPSGQRMQRTQAAADADMTCGWATDNFSAGTKQAHYASQYANAGDDHGFTARSVGAARPRTAPAAPSQPAQSTQLTRRKQDAPDAEMTCGWATDNFSAGSKHAHFARKYANPGEDHSFNSYGMS